jgi:hypothetical protein
MKLINTALAFYLLATIALSSFHVVADTKTHGLNIPFAGSITFGHMRYILQKKSKLNGAKQERIQMLKKAEEEEEENEKRRMFFNKNLEPHSILRDFSAGRF